MEELKQELQKREEESRKVVTRSAASQEGADSELQQLSAQVSALQDQLDDEMSCHAVTQQKLKALQQLAKDACEGEAAMKSQCTKEAQGKAEVQLALDEARQELMAQSARAAADIEERDLFWKQVGGLSNG